MGRPEIMYRGGFVGGGYALARLIHTLYDGPAALRIPQMRYLSRRGKKKFETEYSYSTSRSTQPLQAPVRRR